MNNKFYNLINEKDKDLKWHNCNFYYVTSFVFVLVLIITHLCFREKITLILEQNVLWNIWFLPFRHSNFIHLFGNIMCFLNVSLFLERKFGSFRFLIIIIFAIPLSCLARFLIVGISVYTNGESLVNYFLYGLFFMILIFEFKKYILTKYQNILSFIVIFLFMLLSSFSMSIEFSFLTTLLTANHGTAFVTGLVVGCFNYLTNINTKNK